MPRLANIASPEKIFVCVPKGAVVQVTLTTTIANINATNFIPSFSWVNPGFLSNTSVVGPFEPTCDRHARSNVNAKVEFVRLIKVEGEPVQGAIVKVPGVDISMMALFDVKGMKQIPLVKIKSTKPPNTPPKSVGAGNAGGRRAGGGGAGGSSSAADPLPEFPHIPNERRRRGRKTQGRTQRKQRKTWKQRKTRKSQRKQQTQRR